MTAKMPLEISIGRFSKMTRLSVKALRLYAERGLLVPARVNAVNGYRYYHIDQAKRAEIIKVLRRVEMSLDQIHLILETESDQAIAELLSAHKARLSEKLAEQKRMLNYVEAMIQQNEIAMPYEVTTERQFPQTIATVRLQTTLAKIAADIQWGFAALIEGLAKADIAPLTAPMILYHNVIDEECGGDIEIAIPVDNAFNEIGDVQCRELEDTRVAFVTHKGSYLSLPLAYQSLTQWISENEYSIAGPTREIYLNDPHAVAEAELLTRLEFPLTGTANTRSV